MRDAPPGQQRAQWRATQRLWRRDDQGGAVDQLGPAFAPGRGGGLIAASRSIVYAHEATGEDPSAAARREAARLQELAWSL